MKAIELLKDYRNIDFGCDVEELHNDIDEAIQELEDIQNRTCENCFYFNSKYQLLDINNSITNRCEKLSLYVTDDFSCNKWESK